MASNILHLDKNKVHKALAHSYAVYFFFFLIGVCLDLIFKLKVFSNSIIPSMGYILLIFGTFLILWAQKTSRNLKKENITKETFYRGPYRFTRIPTNFGLFFLILGFGLIANAFFIILFSIVSFVVTRFTFLKEEEKILAEKYGVPYLEYKDLVKF